MEHIYFILRKKKSSDGEKINLQMAKFLLLSYKQNWTFFGNKLLKTYRHPIHTTEHMQVVWLVNNTDVHSDMVAWL